MRLDSVFELQSMTKLLTTIAALQLAERGFVGLDDDVCTLLPELGAKLVLAGFAADGIAPVFRPRAGPITLRHLLTHSAGQAYPILDDRLQSLSEELQLQPAGAMIEECLRQPLSFQPGEDWIYGFNIDWAGRLVEQLTGTSLQTYLEVHVFAPLSITDITFFLGTRPELAARLVTTAVRDAATSTVGGGQRQQMLQPSQTVCFGGHGMFGD